MFSLILLSFSDIFYFVACIKAILQRLYPCSELISLRQDLLGEQVALFDITVVTMLSLFLINLCDPHFTMLRIIFDLG